MTISYEVTAAKTPSRPSSATARRPRGVVRSPDFRDLTAYSAQQLLAEYMFRIHCRILTDDITEDHDNASGAGRAMMFRARIHRDKALLPQRPSRGRRERFDPLLDRSSRCPRRSRAPEIARHGPFCGPQQRFIDPVFTELKGLLMKFVRSARSPPISSIAVPVKVAKNDSSNTL